MKWTVTEAMVTELSVKQGDILRRAATFVRPGGLLLYATCSLFREENEAVVEHFLSVAGEFSVEDAGARLAGIGVKDASAGPYVKLMPHIHETDGFFCAFLRRTLDTGGDPPGQGSSQLPAS